MYNVFCKRCGINPSETNKCVVCGKRSKIVGEVVDIALAVEGGKSNKLFWLTRPGKHRDDIRKRRLLPNGRVARFDRDKRVG